MKLLRFLRPQFLDRALFRNNGLARRIMVAMILFSSAVTAVITAAELYLDYHEDMRGIRERVDTIQNIYLPTLTESVWIAETSQIQTLLGGLLNLRDVDRLEVVSDGKVQWAVGSRSSQRVIETVIPLTRAHRGENLLIGELHVVASMDHVYARLWSKLLVMLVSNAIKTFLVTAFVLLLFQGMVGQHLEHLSAYLRRFGAKGTAQDVLTLNRPSHGMWRPDAFDHVTNAVNMMRAEILQSSQSLQQAHHRLESVISNSPLAIYTHDKDGIVTSWNPAAEWIFNWTAGDAVGHPLRVVPPQKKSELDDIHARVQSGEVIRQLELQWVKRDGSPIDISLSIAPLLDSNGSVSGFLSVVSDITARKLAEQRINYLAFHDLLTGLPNRLLLQERFDRATELALRQDRKVALLFLDLDNFKGINDSLGHDVGDAFLQEVSARLKDCIRETDTICRQGGDEFLIILTDLERAEDASPLIQKMMARLQYPIQLAGEELSTSASIGVGMFPDDGGTFDILHKKADMAMYQAKDAGRNTYRFFDAQINSQAVDNLAIRNALHRALDRNEFVLHYQPQFDLLSHRIVGVEALLRWNHPVLGSVAPSRFIPVAEGNGLIVPIGNWVLQQACRQAAAWKAAGLPELTMAVNLSAIQFKRDDVELQVSQALASTGLDPAKLELELTESILVQDVEGVLACVRRLKRLGVKISIDDFGTGYSSLAYLKQLDIDKLKIDGSFVRDLATDPDDAAIVNAVIQMARSLGLRTIAEGVETEDIVQRLQHYQCDEAQGYYFARPMSADALARLLQSMPPPS
ncbi:EAL domain-containing protein [Curvibacter sp. CHRR-16]|uniref:bifunctional diguanylate cyclase/phosphodiesterase n=1 Tax=Curvibacter sp. CHRR-16 TaxID=2835872 RepID=UPI001BD97D7D|nr:EAL domain-containing protein [Curvibacter sp. CHRR-16]MBT0569051.1 EAL domain-containing protein [Curvibacter sp. CHRR-16]